MTHPGNHAFALRIPRSAARLSAADWAPLVAAVAAWPADEPVTPVVERRIWVERRGGRVQEAVIATLRDPLGMCDAATARLELEELLWPLRRARALRPLTSRQLATFRAPIVRYAAELRELHAAMPEGGHALEPLFTQLVEGLKRTNGPAGLSLLIAPTTREIASNDRDEPDWSAASGEGGDAGAVVDQIPTQDPSLRWRRVAFCLRLFAGVPLSAAIRARAEAVCLARRAVPGDWRMSLLSDELANVARDVADFTFIPGDQTANPEITALTLALPAPRAEHVRLLDGRPLSGRLPSAGPVLGRVARPSGSSAGWRLSWDARRHHVFLAGASGSGKTTTLTRMVLDDVENGRTVVLVDPHGDTVRELTPAMPRERLTVVDPRLAQTSPLDLLDADPARATAHLLSAASEVWPTEFAGPVWHRVMSLATRTLAASAMTDRRFTLADIERFMTDVRWRNSVIEAVEDVSLKTEVSREHRAWQIQPNGTDSSLINWASAKLTPLTRGPGARLFDTAPAYSLEQQIAGGHVILVALPIGVLGDTTTRLVARMFLTRLTAAIASQGAVAEHERHPAAVFLDEAHLMSGQALRGLFAQARKFNCSITVACQSPSQLEPGLEEVLTNAQTHLLGRLSHREAIRLGDRIGAGGVRVLPTLPRHHLLLALEDSDPLLEPVLLTPVPVPKLPAWPDRNADVPVTERLAGPADQDPEATAVVSAQLPPPVRSAGPSGGRMSADDVLCADTDTDGGAESGLSEILDELFPTARRSM